MGREILNYFILKGMDVSTWSRKADEMKTDEENTRNTQLLRSASMIIFIISSTELNIQWYIPFYSLYFILTVLQLNFAHSAFGVGRRFRRLNLAMKRYYLPNELPEVWQKSSPKVPTPAGVTTLNGAVAVKNITEMLTNKVTPFMIRTVTRQLKPVLSIDDLGYIYYSLGKCVEILSR